MNKLKNRLKGLINRYTILLLFTYFVFGVSFSYAYFAFREENTSTIVGNVVAIDADLTVERVVGTNTKMVPLKDDALGNAIKGEGGQSACVDANGNLSCQVYKITLTNNASRFQHIIGTVELYAKDGANNVYNNLKWRELTNQNTVNEDTMINGMSKSLLAFDFTLESKESRDWYIAVWISETIHDQTDTDKGEFGGIVTFGDVPGNIFTETIMAPNAQSDADINFGIPSSSSGTDGIYLRSGTENDLYPIYYYRGDVDNNLIFADMCWKVVRTTETGGLKLLYNGLPSTEGKCDNTGEDTTIGSMKFNENDNSPAYVGYMYSNPYTADYREMDNTTTYLYANDVTYSNGVYTLLNTNAPAITSSNWTNLNQNGLINNHYTCFTTETTCEEVYYIYQTYAEEYEGEFYGEAHYLILNNGKNIEEALVDMLGSDEGDSSLYNTTSSTIKGSNQAEGSLDYWYYNEIEQKGYSDYIEDTVWCNDRSIYQLGGFNPNGGPTDTLTDEALEISTLKFSELGSLFDYYYDIPVTVTPKLTCSRNIDKFTVGSVRGNADLDYPVGLLTYSETVLAGGFFELNKDYYLNNWYSYWSGAPVFFRYDGAFVSFVDSVGIVSGTNVYTGASARPSVSLKPGFSLVGDGDGSVENPYIISTMSSSLGRPTYLNGVKTGSYVAYTGDSENGCDNINTVNGWTSCSGKNANYVSDTNMGNCNNPSYKFNVNGWRVGYIENGSVHLVSAGATDCMCSDSSGNASSISCSNNLSSANLYMHFDNMDSLALKYCNKDYAKWGLCNNDTAWAMDTIDFEKIIGKALNSSSCYNSSNDASCGYSNDLIDNGGFYWYATPYSASSRSMFIWSPINRYVNGNSSNFVRGVRPVLALDSSIRVTGGSGTYEDPYIISKQ